MALFYQCPSSLLGYKYHRNQEPCLVFFIPECPAPNTLSGTWQVFNEYVLNERMRQHPSPKARVTWWSSAENSSGHQSVDPYGALTRRQHYGGMRERLGQKY